MKEVLINEKIKNKKVNFLVNVAFAAVICAIIFVIFKYCINQVLPLVLGFILAAVARPLTHLLSDETRKVKHKDGTVTEEKRKFRLPQKVAAIISVVVLLLVLGGIVTLFITRIVQIIIDYAQKLPGYYTSTLQPALVELSSKFDSWSETMDPELAEFLQTGYAGIISNIGSLIARVSEKVAGWGLTAAKDIPSALLAAIITVIATIFFAIDFESMKTFFKRLFSPKTVNIVAEVKESFLDIVWQFIKSYAIIFVITVAEISIGVTICGFKNALLIGLVIGIFDAFPIVGSGMILLPWSIIAMLTGPVWQGIGLLIVWAVVVVVREFLEPKVVGTRVGLRPLVTLVCMYVGNKLFGVWGLFGLPITAAILTDLESNGYIRLFWDERHSEDADAADDGAEASAPAAEKAPAKESAPAAPAEEKASEASPEQ